MGNDDMSKLSHGQLLSLIFTNPFVKKEVQLAAMDEYRRRMKAEICNSDAIEFICNKSGLSEDVVCRVLQLYEDFMKSTGDIIKTIQEKEDAELVRNHE